MKKFSISQAVQSQGGMSGKKSAVTTYNKIDMIFPAPLGKILVFTNEEGGALALYDISARKILFELSISDVKSVYWNQNFTNAAIVTKTCKNILLIKL